MPGTIGCRYGHTVKEYDLMNNLLTDITENPYGRYHIMNLWQEEEFRRSDGLKPCAYETIWSVRDDYLDMFLMQRSGDMLVASGAGGYNEVGYTALLMMVAKHTGYKPGKFTHFVANEQLYSRHINASKELMNRYERNEDNGKLVTMVFEPKSNNFYDFTIDDFKLINYEPIKPQITLELGI